MKGYQKIGRKDNPNQSAGWVTRCKGCGDWITIRHRKESYCLYCQANKCSMDPSGFKRFYRHSAWRKMRKLIFQEKGIDCVYCGNLATHIDHKKPLSIGGTNEPKNLRPVCGICNVKKQSKTHEEFIKLSTGKR